jgi:hypothetical protein
MAWIESHQELANHPKTKRLARALGISRVQVIGHLHMLWWWALDYAQDGNLNGYSNEDLADAAMWEGDPDQFVAALIGCGINNGAGFLEIDSDNNLLLHDWYEYAGKLIERRKANAQRMREKRAAHVQNTCSARAPATVPNSTVQNHIYMSANAESASADSAINDLVNEVFAHYKAKILPNAKLTPQARKKLTARLKEFSVEQIKEGMDNFSRDYFSMENNAHRGLAWWCHSEDRVLGYINLKPKPKPEPSGNNRYQLEPNRPPPVSEVCKW